MTVSAARRRSDTRRPQLAVRAEPEHLEVLDRIAEATGTTRSEVVRAALVHAVERHPEELTELVAALASARSGGGRS